MKKLIRNGGRGPAGSANVQAPSSSNGVTTSSLVLAISLPAPDKADACGKGEGSCLAHKNHTSSIIPTVYHYLSSHIP